MVRQSEQAAMAALNARAVTVELLRQWLVHPNAKVRAVAALELRRRG